MRSLSKGEIKEFLDEWTWGTLIVIDRDKPYAIEVSYATDGVFVYCSSMPGGRMSQCIKKNANVSLKVCDASKDTSKFRAVIVEGCVEKLSQRDEIVKGLQVLYRKMGLPESRIEQRADQLTLKAEDSSFYRITIKDMGGRAMGA